MARVLASTEVDVSVDRAWGVVDDACIEDTHDPVAPADAWIRVARGMAYLQCPWNVITARLRLESWSTVPPNDDRQWSGWGEVDLELPSGVVGVDLVDGGEPGLLALPSPGRYRVRMRWVFNPGAGPFHSPLKGGAPIVMVHEGHGRELEGVDEFCLVQFWLHEE